MTYEVYGYSYLNDGIWGDMWLADYENKKDAVRFASDIVDGEQFTNSSVYAVSDPEGEEYEIIYTYY